MISVTRRVTDSQDLDHVDRSKPNTPSLLDSDTYTRAKPTLKYASSNQNWRLSGRESSFIMAGQQRHPFGYDFYQSHHHQQPQQQQHQHQQQPPPPQTDEVPEPGANPLLNPREDGFLAQFYNTHPQSHSHHEHPQQVEFGNGRPIMGAHTPSAEATPDHNFGWLMSEPPPIVHDINATPMPVQNTGVHGSSQHHHVTTPMTAHSLMDYFPAQNQMSTEDILGATILSQPVHGQQLQQQHFLSPPLQQARQFSQPQIMANTTTTTTTSTAGGIEPIHTQAALEGITSAENSSMTALQSSALMNLIPRIDTSAATLSHTNMPHFAVPQTAPILPSRRTRGIREANPRLYDFGTDTRFDGNGFRTSSEHERHDFREEQLTEELKLMKPINRTPDPSVPPSPAFVNVSTNISAGLNLGTKRQRSEDDDEDELSTKRVRGSSPKRRQRRASAPGAPLAKKKREKEEKEEANKRDPLNDEQKRQNHIASEQKRRNQIREGFEELNRIVPDLKEGGFSKSAVLVEVASFAMRLLRSNDELRRRLGIPKESNSDIEEDNVL